MSVRPPLHRRHGLLKVLLTGAFTFFFTQSAQANAGTPLMWAGMFHLFIGNAIIGVLEGLLLVQWYSAPSRKAPLIMIAANYFSAWAGTLILGGLLLPALPITIENVRLWLFVSVIITYLATLLLEWPFTWWCLKGQQDSMRLSIRGTIKVQSWSYAILFAGYFLVSGTSLATRLKVVSASELPLPASVQVYFISRNSGDAMLLDNSGGAQRKEFDLGSTQYNDRLVALTNATNPGKWDLVARLETGSREGLFKTLATNLSVTAAPDWRTAKAQEPRDIPNTWFTFGAVPKLGEAESSSWKFRTGFWAAEGLRGENLAPKETIRFSLETPFLSWEVRNAVHLPGDKILFQLGKDQICLLDIPTRRVALLARGRGPAALQSRPTTNDGVAK